MKILAIETSCDETAVAIIEDGRKILSSEVYSQAEMHETYGGVVPEIASRKHVEIISYICDEALKKANLDKSEIDAVAGTCAPGLIGALLVGANFAKSLAFSLNVPFIPVHHIRGHIAANYLASDDIKPPFLCLVASGGHSLIVHVKDYTDMEIIGSTRDDAAGEAFDKVARVLGIGYPGGKILDDLAQTGDSTYYKLPRAKINNAPLDFSFSGLKTAVINLIHNAKQKDEQINHNHLAASFCSAVSDTLVSRFKLSAEITGLRTFVMAGGVAANSVIRRDMQSLANELGAKLYLLPLSLCSDNAAMIGSQAYYEYLNGNIGNAYQNAFATMDVNKNFEKI